MGAILFQTLLGCFWFGIITSQAQVDTEDPVVEIVNARSTKLGSEHYHFSFPIQASDDVGVVGLEYRSAVSLGPFGDWEPWPYEGPSHPLEVELFCWAYDFEVRAVDAAGNRSAVDGWSFSEPVIRPIFRGPFLVSGKVGKAFRYRIRATKSTHYFAVGLPRGLSVDRRTGWISGKPKKAGEYHPLIFAGNSIMTARRITTFKISR